MKRGIFFLIYLFLYSSVVAQSTNMPLLQGTLDSVNILIEGAQYEKAEQFGRRALQVYKKGLTVEDTLLARFYNVLGEIKLNSDLQDSAFYYLSEGLSLLEQSNQSKGRIAATTYYHLGRYYCNFKKYDKSIFYFEKAIVLQKNREQHLDMSYSYNRLGLVYCRLKDYEKASDIFNKELSLKLKILGEQHMKTADPYENLGIVFYYQGAYRKAIQFFNKALNIRLEVRGENNEMVLHVYNSIGTCYFERGEYKKALDCYNKGLNIRLALFGEIHTETANSYNTLGKVYRKMGDYEKAVLYSEKGLRIRLEVVGKQGIETADSYNTLGDIYNETGEYEKAIGYFEKSKDIYLENFSKISNHIFFALYNLGKVYSNLENYNIAIQYFNQSQQAYLKYNKTKSRYQALPYDGLGIVYLKQGNYNEAISVLKHALNTRLDVLEEKDVSVVKNYRDLGVAYHKNGDYKKAVQMYSKAMKGLRYNIARPAFFSNVSDLYLLQDIFFHRIKTYKALDRKELGKYADTVKKISQQLLLLQDYIYQELPDQSTQQMHVNESYLIYEDLIATHLQDFSNAFQIAEKSKSRQLSANFRQTNAQQLSAIPDSLIRKEHDLKVEITEFEKKRYKEEFESHLPKDSLINGYKNKLFSLKREREALILNFEENYPNYHQIKYNHKVSSVGQLQNLLAADQALVEYFVGDSSIFIFVITPDHFKVHQIKKDFPLKEWVDQMRKGIYGYWVKFGQSDRVYAQNKEDYTKYAQLLYEKLLAPVQPLLPEKLIVIPDGVLHLVPFDALLTEETSVEFSFREYPYLLKKHQISYNYSATLYQYLNQQKSADTSMDFLAFAPTFNNQQTTISKNVEDIRKDLGILRFNIPEVKAIQTLLGGEILKGEEATEENFFLRAIDSKIIHLATHAKSNDKVGDYSFIAFTEIPDSIQDNELLYVSELYNLKFNADLVVLSACEAGIGELRKGEGAISLSRAFLYAGAHSVLTSLWSVNDAKTERLMTGFYQNLKNGATKDEALRATKLAYLKHENAPDPFFWAAFVPVGNMAPLDLSTSISFWWFFFGGISFIIILILTLKKMN